MLVAAPVQHARAQDDAAAKNGSSFTVYGGYRFAGSVRDSTTDSTINLRNGSSFALALDIGLDQNNQVEVFYSQQNSALAPGTFSSKASNIGLTLYNYQIGGTKFFQEGGRRLYARRRPRGRRVETDRRRRQLQ